MAAPVLLCCGLSCWRAPMKSCPACNRTFEDTFTFCLADGSLLDAPFDPHATLVIPEPRQTAPPPTELLVPEEKAVEIPQTIASPQPGRKAEELVPNISTHAPVFDSPQIQWSPVGPTRRSMRWLWVTCGILVLVVAGVVIAIKLRKAALKRATEAQETAIRQHFSTAAKLQGEKNYTGAEAEYREVLKLDPNNPEAHFSLFILLDGQQKYEEAEAEAREAVRLSPKNSDYHYEFAFRLELRKKYAEAEEQYKELIQLSINHPPAKDLLPTYYRTLGEVQEAQKKYAEAEASFREALRLDPNDKSADLGLGRVLYAQRN
jgi:Tfp pilus assembly protein PilF